MKETGFHTWGFRIYRCTSYEDDELWAIFLNFFKQDIHNDLSRRGGQKLFLERYADWTVIEDKSLEGASKEEIRSQFISWRDEHSVSRQRPPMSFDDEASLRLPRFTYCLYVDEDCMETVKTRVDMMAKGKGPFAPGQLWSAVVVIDADYDSRTAPRGYPGWAYFETGNLATFYESLHESRLREMDYMYPPKIGPAGLDVMPTSSR